MLEPLEDNFSYFLVDSLRQWYCSTWVAILFVLTIFMCHEEQSDEGTTRQVYFAKLNCPYYIYMIFSTMFVPIYFQGDGRFYTFLIGLNTLPILYFASLLNPYYIQSYHYPMLEEMSDCKVVWFSLFELLVYFCTAFGHLAWGYYLVNVSEYNKYYCTINELARYKTGVFFCVTAFNPAIMLVFNGLLQFTIRCVKAVRREALYESEAQASYRPAYKSYLAAKKTTKLQQQMQANRIHQRLVRDITFK